MSYETDILDLVAATPGIRAVQIADKVDLDMDVVEQIMARLVGAGKVTTRIETASNDRKVVAYTAKDGAAQPAAPAAAPAVEAPAPAPAPAPAAKVTGAKTKRPCKRKEAAPAPAADSQFRCALWSDGVLEIRRGASPVITFTRDEQAVLIRAMGAICA